MRVEAVVLLLGTIAACGGGDDGIQADAAPDAPPQVTDNGIAWCARPMIHISFGGHRVEHGDVDDARELESINGGLEAQPITDLAWTDAVAANVGTRLAALRIPMSRTRPLSGDFTMIVFDADPLELGGDQWRFPRDCASSNPNNVVLMNGAMFVQETAETAGSAVLYAIGRTVGLDNVMAQQNCMAYLLHDTCNFADAVQTTGEPCGSAQQSQVDALTDAFGCP